MAADVGRLHAARKYDIQYIDFGSCRELKYLTSYRCTTVCTDVVDLRGLVTEVVAGLLTYSLTNERATTST